jgi:SAM-dependent methyltransferase
MTAPLDAEYFDNWYRAMPASPVKDEIQQRHLGLPRYLLSTSLLSWHGIADVVSALQLDQGKVLLDLACGRGGYGLEIAHRTHADLVGVDFSAEAIRQAASQAAKLGRQADFRVGELTRTGLPDAAVDAVVCIDAVQFADPPAAAYREIFRVVRPNGRVVLTSWEAATDRSKDLPERLRRVDLQRGLTDAGFRHVEVQERADWRHAEWLMWQEAGALDPGDDPALQSFHAEGVRSLANFDLLRRVFAVAVR